MSPEEQSFFDHVAPMDATATAISYDFAVRLDPAASPEEQDFGNYLQGLLPEEAEEAKYAVYSAKFDITPEPEHAAFESQFSQLGYSLAICKKRKSPEN